MASSTLAHAPADLEVLQRTRPRGRRMPWLMRVGVTFLVLLAALAVVAPWVVQDPERQSLRVRLKPPTLEGADGHPHYLGTDHLGRDVLARVVFGSRVSLVVGLAAVTVGGIIGSTLGLIAGYRGGRLDEVIMTVADAQLAFPFVLLAIAVIAVAGPSIPVLIIVLAIGSWVGHARIVRGLILGLREREYVQAARALGAGTPRVMFRHLLPEVLSVILVLATFDVGRIIILESSLSFLGLGVQPPTPSWGSDLRDAAAYVRQAWWIAAFPGLAIMIVVLGVNLVGDVLRDILDPRSVPAVRRA